MNQSDEFTQQDHHGMCDVIGWNKKRAWLIGVQTQGINRSIQSLGKYTARKVTLCEVKGKFNTRNNLVSRRLWLVAVVKVSEISTFIIQSYVYKDFLMRSRNERL